MNHSISFLRQHCVASPRPLVLRITTASRLRALVVVLFMGVAGNSVAQGQVAAADDVYQTGPRTRDGIGKYYMGREISQVMGHRGTRWLERRSRVMEERTDLLLDYLASLPGKTFADIGAGSGYFSIPLAQRLDSSRVLAVDIQRQMLNRIERRAKQIGIENIELVRGAVDDPRLPVGAVDVVFIVDAYHEFSHPREMMEGIVAGLRDDGRVILVEYRGEDGRVPIKRLHKMTQQQAIRELEAAGLEWQKTEDLLPQQHVMVFTKAAQ